MFIVFTTLSPPQQDNESSCLEEQDIGGRGFSQVILILWLICVDLTISFLLATAAEIVQTCHNTEEGHLLHLPTQPCFKLLSDDPYKSVSVAQRRCSKRNPCYENSLWRLTLSAHRAARLEGNEPKLSLQRIHIFGLNHGMRWSFSHSQSGSIRFLLAGQFVQLSVVMNQSILKSVLSPHKLWCYNSPGSCCRGELRWGYCWGWTRARAPPWCGEPLHSLKMSKQRGRPMLLECRLISAQKRQLSYRWHH